MNGPLNKENNTGGEREWSYIYSEIDVCNTDQEKVIKKQTLPDRKSVV